MINKSLGLSLLILLFVILVNPTSVLSLGLSPGNFNVINYKPGEQVNVSFSIINNINEAIEVDASIIRENLSDEKEDLIPFITLEKKRFELGPKESVKSYFIFNTPTNLTPGIHKAYLKIVEDRKQIGQVGARAAVINSIKVKVPFDGYYIETGLNAPDIKINSTGTFVVRASNYGTQEINSLYADIRIMNLENKTIATIKTPTYHDLNTFGTVNLKSYFEAKNIGEATYKAIATVYYDDRKKDTNYDTFRIGDIKVNLLNWTRRIKSGQIDRFNLTLKNEWNTPVTLNTEVSVKNKTSLKQVYYIKTPDYTLKPWQTMVIPMFIDATNINPENYSLNIKVYYASVVLTKNSVLTVFEERKRSLPGSKGMLMWGIGIFVLILLLLLMLKRKKKEKTSYNNSLTTDNLKIDKVNPDEPGV
ncbi:MAG: hypothetical protein GWP09_00890 [Nitrospiraceae bacterium]|nr:hypothetical protein [Nitrospiraceae bacterium]